MRACATEPLLALLALLSTAATAAAVEADGCDSDTAEEEDAMLDKLMRSYNKQALPRRRGNVATVEMHINDIPSISELQSEFELDLMYSEMWSDPRLSYDGDERMSQCVPNITLDLDYLTRLWTPNTCIVNSKSAEIHASPNPNIFLILYSSGKVWKNCRMRVRAPCDIDLRFFPFDRQKCGMTFESYSYNMEKVSLRWYDDPITINKAINLPDFTLTHWKNEQNVVAYPNGNWDQLKVTLYFQRRYGFFILQAYVPTFITIFVAWINFWFWMDPTDQLATRATLGISAFLAITLQFGNILKNQPPVSYVKAMDVWMLGCIIFLFTALAELAVVSYVLRNDKHRLMTAASQRLLANGHGAEHGSVDAPLGRRWSDLSVYVAYKADRACLIGFPPLFIAFNLVYWCYYASADDPE